MTRALALTIFLSSFAALAADSVLVVRYQSVGVKDETVDEAGRALLKAAGARGLTVLAADEFQRAAAMCGEDANCLGTVGQRARARWVLGYGLGAVGSNVLLSGVLIDAASGAQTAAGSRKFEKASREVASTAGALADELLAKIPPRLEPVVEPPKEEKPTQVVIVTPPPEEKPRRNLAPFAWGSGGLAVAMLGTGTYFGMRAQSNHRQLPELSGAAHDAAVERQRSLNTTADVFFGGAILAGSTALVLFLLDR